ncbi:MAG: peroxidase-related enzyme [Acidobacteriota bacterium]
MEAVKHDHHKAHLDAADTAMLDFAVKLTRTPARMKEEDLAALRNHGFSDRAIHEMVQITALFNYYNRVADGLGIDPEPD